MRNYENADKMAVRLRLLFPCWFINGLKQFIDDFLSLIFKMESLK